MSGVKLPKDECSTILWTKSYVRSPGLGCRKSHLDLGSESLPGVFLTCKFTLVVEVEESRDVRLSVQCQEFVTRR
jgi:hypothetical protein